ncbi:MAG: putative baseplate assembly protein [Actinomycetota bacterium]|nr:putative baseplate assembly protein [Actinomycetota bacterium]
MTLPTPILDDRHFQDIVDEAKQLIPRYCPEWTDHNVSDPGVALVELFAWLAEMILYRANQIPDKHYTKFLELMGIRLFPAAPAETDVAFWLSSPQAEAVRIHAKTQVGTLRTEQEESIVFMTDEDLTIVTPELTHCITSSEEGPYEDHWDELRVPGESVTCFRHTRPGDAIYFGFADGVASNIIRFDFEATIEGVGVDPRRPPWAWEAWNGEGWEEARIYEDVTGGLNRNGSLILFLPRRHEPLTVGAFRANWIRCRMVDPAADQPAYESSPKVASAKAVSLGGIMTAHHGLLTPEEFVGRSDGSAGQVFTVRRTPVLPRTENEFVKVVTSEGTEEWKEVSDFSDSGPQDRHYTWDGSTGEISFGPDVKHPDGSSHQHGAIPPVDSRIVVTEYRHGGGEIGNVGAGTLTVLKSSVPFIARVENPKPARGGVDPESVENLKRRGPMSLRTAQRAVTTQDFERLTVEASPLVARAKCVAPDDPKKPIRVLIVPRVKVAPDVLELDDLALPERLVEAVTGYLEERRLLTTTVEIGTPFYQGLTVVARMRGAPGADPEFLRDRLLTELYLYINPLTGGPQGNGWPFGREINVGEVFARLAGVEGVVGVEEVNLFLADLRTGERREGRQRVQLSNDAVFASFQHQVLIR